MFGNFRPRASRVPATRRVLYNWRLFEALSSNAPHPTLPPPLTKPLPCGTPISPQYTLVVISATFPFSKCQQGLQLHIYLQFPYGKFTRTKLLVVLIANFPEFYAICNFRYRAHTQSRNSSPSSVPDEFNPRPPILSRSDILWICSSIYTSVFILVPFLHLFLPTFIPYKFCINSHERYIYSVVNRAPCITMCMGNLRHSTTDL